MTTVNPASERDKSYCDANKRNGDTCRRPAGWGTGHPGFGRCKLHGGATQTHINAAKRIQLEQAAAKFGLPRTVDPAAAIVEALHKQAGQVDYFEGEVDRLPSPWIEQQVPGGARVEEHPAVTAYRQALDRFFSFGERTIKLGLAERQVQVDELQVQIMGRAFLAMLASPELGLTREQQEAGRRVAAVQIRELMKNTAA